MKNKNHINYGLIGAIILCALFMIQWFAKIPFDQVLYKWLPTAVFLGLIIAGAMNFSKINDADVTFGEVFGNGFKTTAVIAVISALFYVLFTQLIPGYKEAILDFSMSQGPNAGDPEAAAKGREMFANNFMVFTVAGSVFFNLLTGVVGSLIGAAIAKKRK
jgi:hypothetical protein